MIDCTFDSYSSDFFIEHNSQSEALGNTFEGIFQFVLQSSYCGVLALPMKLNELNFTEGMLRVDAELPKGNSS